MPKTAAEMTGAGLGFTKLNLSTVLVVPGPRGPDRRLGAQARFRAEVFNIPRDRGDVLLRHFHEWLRVSSDTSHARRGPERVERGRFLVSGSLVQGSLRHFQTSPGDPDRIARFHRFPNTLTIISISTCQGHNRTYWERRYFIDYSGLSSPSALWPTCLLAYLFRVQLCSLPFQSMSIRACALRSTHLLDRAVQPTRLIVIYSSLAPSHRSRPEAPSLLVPLDALRPFEWKRALVWGRSKISIPRPAPDTFDEIGDPRVEPVAANLLCLEVGTLPQSKRGAKPRTNDLHKRTKKLSVPAVPGDGETPGHALLSATPSTLDMVAGGSGVEIEPYFVSHMAAGQGHDLFQYRRWHVSSPVVPIEADRVDRVDVVVVGELGMHTNRAGFTVTKCKYGYSYGRLVREWEQYFWLYGTDRQGPSG
ncbi:hypothetical protein BJV78DRAFT_1158233 [Lactifluus subvellereus]|nr:hypothetical protein BJV78DRAFT_1158233 [Lactifluus subvellereus]